MRDNETNTPEETTLLQRFFARLFDTNPARYSAAIQGRTFGRVILDDTAAHRGASATPAKPPQRASTVMSHRATPRSAT